MTCPFGMKASKLLTEHAELLKDKKTALDIGCAHGSNSIYLNQQGLKVVAIDKKIPEDFMNENIKIIETNVLDFEFDNYDIVLALNVLQFLNKANKIKILNKIVKALNKDGILFISAFTDKDSSYGKSPFITGHFKENELRSFAENNGLKIVHYIEKIIKDNHDPIGPHEHGIVELIAKK